MIRFESFVLLGGVVFKFGELLLEMGLRDSVISAVLLMEDL